MDIWTFGHHAVDTPFPSLPPGCSADKNDGRPKLREAKILEKNIAGNHGKIRRENLDFEKMILGNFKTWVRMVVIL